MKFSTIIYISSVVKKLKKNSSKVKDKTQNTLLR